MEWTDDKPRKFGAVTPWFVLLAISLLINYVDRGNLSLAAPLLKNELHLTAWQLGILFSAFFWTYTALQFVMGWVVDRFEVNLVIAVGYLVWSLATATTGLVRGFTMLLTMRLLLGIGESVAFPSCSKILARHVPEENRGFANGILIAGLKSGPAVGTFGAGLLMAGLEKMDAARTRTSPGRRDGTPYGGWHFTSALVLGCLHRSVLCQLPCYISWSRGFRTIWYTSVIFPLTRWRRLRPCITSWMQHRQSLLVGFRTSGYAAASPQPWSENRLWRSDTRQQP